MKPPVVLELAVLLVTERVPENQNKICINNNDLCFGSWSLLVNNKNKLVKAIILITSSLIMCGPCALGFEKTTVLPQGIRMISTKHVFGNIESKYNQSGSVETLGKALEKDIRIENIINKQTGVERKLSAALLTKEFSEKEVLGSFSSNMKVKMKVTAPVISYGISNHLTLAVAVPYYQASLGVGLGFTTTNKAAQVVSYLHSEENNAKVIAFNEVKINVPKWNAEEEDRLALEAQQEELAQQVEHGKDEDRQHEEDHGG